MKEFTLVGFKPSNSLEWYHNLRPSIFVYPDNEQVRGSSAFSDALIKELIADDKIAYCRFKPSELHTYRFCFLIPQIETQDQPAGFQMIILPFKEEVRNIEEDYFQQLESIVQIMGDGPDIDQCKYLSAVEDYFKVTKVDKLEVNLMKTSSAQRANIIQKITRLTPTQAEITDDLIEALTVPEFSPSYFENPDVQTFYSNLQALALNEDTPEDVFDSTKPDEDGLAQHSREIERFKQVFSLSSKPTAVNLKILKSKIKNKG